MNSNQDLISIIVPIYKVEKYLRNCLDSVCNQTYSNLEIILVDDGSPDKCPSICEEYRKRDNRITVIHQQNQGLSQARNAGINISTGKYLVFVDSDDTVEKTMVEKLYVCLNKYNCLMAVCGKYYTFANGKKIYKKQKEEDKVFNFFDAIKEMNSYNLFDMSAWAKIYHRKLFDQIRFPIGKLSEDYFVMYKIIELAQEVGYVSEPLYNYFQRENSISRNKKINHDFIEAAKAQMEYLQEKYPKLKSTVHIAFASANLTVLDFYIKSKVKCPKSKISEFKKAVRENISFIRKEKSISRKKRLQFELFLKSYPLYYLIFSLYRKIRRV